MKGKFFLICLMTLIIITSLMFSNSLSFALYEPETTVVAWSDEVDNRFSEAQEEEMKDEWYVVPEDDGNGVIVLEPDEDTFKDAPYRWDTEEDDEGSPEPYKFEEEPEDEPSTDTESRR